MSDDATNTGSTAFAPSKVKLDHDRGGYASSGVHRPSSKDALYEQLRKAAANTAKLKRSS